MKYHVYINGGPLYTLVSRPQSQRFSLLLAFWFCHQIAPVALMTAAMDRLPPGTEIIEASAGKGKVLLVPKPSTDPNQPLVRIDIFTHRKASLTSHRRIGLLPAKQSNSPS